MRRGARASRQEVAARTDQPIERFVCQKNCVRTIGHHQARSGTDRDRRGGKRLKCFRMVSDDDRSSRPFPRSENPGAGGALDALSPLEQAQPPLRSGRTPSATSWTTSRCARGAPEGFWLPDLTIPAVTPFRRVCLELVGVMKDSVSDFEEAIDRLVAGSSAPIALINPKKKGIVAYREAGHAPVAESRGHADRTSKAGRRRRNASGYRGVAAATVASTIEENSHTGSDHAAN
jgi:hypothetical protein